METVNPSGAIQEIQIKGAGRTPFSRHADGLAVLRSSIRECEFYLLIWPFDWFLTITIFAVLGSENASAFPDNTLPTSRSLSLAVLPTLPVNREYGPEKGAIASRIAPTFLRIGSFEILNPPENEFVFSFSGGHGYAGDEWDLMRDLAGIVKARLGLGEEVRTWDLVKEVSRRNAKMVAGWQAWGFMHGGLFQVVSGRLG